LHCIDEENAYRLDEDGYFRDEPIPEPMEMDETEAVPQPDPRAKGNRLQSLLWFEII